MYTTTLFRIPQWR